MLKNYNYLDDFKEKSIYNKIRIIVLKINKMNFIIDLCEEKRDEIII